MGFWDSVGKVAKSVGNAALNEGKAAIDRSQQYKSEMSNKSDSELFSIIKKELSSSPMKAGAAKKELETRDYDKDEIVAKVKSL